MDVHKTIQKRRAYRSLESIKISDEIVNDLAHYASLAPSCYNNQPWRFVFVKNPDKLKEVFTALPDGNVWATKSSMVIAAYSKKDLDCVVGKREYYLFDTGMATAFLILRATELGLVAHPIAGYDAEKVKAILEIPKDVTLIALIVVGRHSEQINELLSDWQKEQERERPERRTFEEIAKIF